MFLCHKTRLDTRDAYASLVKLRLGRRLKHRGSEKLVMGGPGLGLSQSQCLVKWHRVTVIVKCGGTVG